MSRMLFICLAATLANAEIFFEEQFKDGYESNWVSSTAKGAQAGKFVHSAGKFYGDAELDKGIQTSEDARFYGLSAKFPAAFSNEGKDLVIQFSVKHEQNIDCGGGYVKVFDSSLDQAGMHGDSPYLIMFGPDICGPGTKKVHVIFNYKGENHLIKKEIRCKDDVFTHLYTLVVKPDNTYVVKIDDTEAEAGSLEGDWDLLPPKKIKDQSASRPADWDDRAKIDDPEAEKPADWDVAEHVADPAAEKPADWDDEMDGEWEAPMIDNPEYKGEWKPPQIDNPNYSGVWVHPEIDNPDYTPDDKMYMYADIAAVGFDLWQVKSGTIFDTLLVTDSEAAASEQAQALWATTRDAEKKMKDAQDAEEAAKRAQEEKDNPPPPEDEDEADEDEDDEPPMDEDDDELHDEL